jgi:hypothetical protein
MSSLKLSHKSYQRIESLESTRWFKYDRDDLCVNKPQFVPVIFEPPCTISLEKMGYVLKLAVLPE